MKYSSACRFVQNIKRRGFFKGEPGSKTHGFKYEINKLGWFLLITAELLKNQAEMSSYNSGNPTTQSFLVEERKNKIFKA